jgi:hypothetical protein
LRAQGELRLMPESPNENRPKLGSGRLDGVSFWTGYPASKA